MDGKYEEYPGIEAILEAVCHITTVGHRSVGDVGQDLEAKEKANKAEPNQAHHVAEEVSEFRFCSLATLT